MKTMIFLLSFIFFVTGINNAQDKNTKPKSSAVATFQKVIKKVYYIKPLDKPIKVEEKNRGNYPLFNKDEVKTEENSIAIVGFLDKSKLIVQPNSEVTIHGSTDNKGESSAVQTDTRVSRGSTYFKVEKQKDKGEFKFTTPTMVASIRGTAGLVKSDNDTVSSLTVEEGLVYVESRNGAIGKGNVEAGKTAKVYSDGKVVINDTEAAIKKELEKAKYSASKSIKIKASNGDATIYYEEDQK